MISGSGSFADASSPTTSVSNLSVGVNTFAWTISNGTCSPSADEVSVTVEETPTISAAGDDQTICSATASLAGNTPTLGTGTWTVISGSGTFADASSPTTSVSNLSVGVNTFAWTISNGTCSPSADEVSITVEESPTVSAAGDDQTICATTATLAGNTPAIGSGIWTVISGSGTFADAGSPTTSVSNLAAGVNTFAWTISNGTCAPSADEVSITVEESPTIGFAGNDQTICATTATLAGNTPTTGTGIWTLISGSGTFADASSPTTSVSNLSVGVNTFAWTISNGTCTPSTDEVSVTVEQAPTISAAGDDQTICAITATLAGNTPAIGTGIWTIVSGSGTFADASSPTTSVSNLAVGVNTFAWTISNGTCTSSTDQVSINVDQNPVTPNAGTDQTICATSSTLNATAVPGGSWTVISGSGNIANTGVSKLSSFQSFNRHKHFPLDNFWWIMS